MVEDEAKFLSAPLTVIARGACHSLRSPRMKIALSLESFDPRRGGLEQWTHRFARALVTHGHEVHVVAFDFPAGDELAGVKTHPLASSTSRLERAGRLEKKLRGLDADVVHDMGCGWCADVFHPHGGSTLAWREHNLQRIPAWRRLRFWQEKRYREQREIERRQHDTAAAIVCVSRMTQRHFQELHGLPAERLPVIYNGVEADRFSPAPRRAARNETTFLLVAHNLALKNASTAICALARLRTSGWGARLIIAGSRRTERAAQLAKRLGIEDAVDFRGVVEAMPALYASVDVCVHPTWYDPCSLVTLEAWASALPVLTTRCNGAVELMRDGEHGFVLDDPGDVEALAEKMRLLLDPERCGRLGAAARALALEHTFTRNVEEFLALYERVRGRRFALNK